MTRTLYIHIGVQRTATTSTQRFLRNNHAALQRQGFLQYNGVPRHQKLMLSMFGGDVSAAEACDRLTRQADACDHQIDRIMLTDEDVCANEDMSVLAGFRDVFDVKIVVSLRRQDRWIESWYSQNIKWQWIPLLSHLPFDEFLDQREMFDWVHYDRLMDRLEPVFGRENILPLVFEPSQMPDGPLAAFCQAVGITQDDTLTYPDHKANASPSALMGEFMRLLPLDEMDEATRLRAERACLKADWWVKRKYDTKSTLLMDIETRTRLMAEYAEGNARVARDYFGRDQLFAEPLPAADAPLALQQLPDDSYKLMEDFVGPVMRFLMTDPPKGGS